MPNRLTGEPHGRRRELGGALPWGLGGGAAVLALTLLLYALAASLGEWLAGAPPQAMSRLASAQMYQVFAAIFLVSSALLFAARGFGVGTR